MRQTHYIARSAGQASWQPRSFSDEQHRVVRGVVTAVFVSLPVWLTVGSLTLIILR